MREYDFELRLAALLERDGLPTGPEAGILARQLGTSVTGAGERILDLVAVSPGPDFDTRLDLAAETIPPLVVESDLGVGTARSVTQSIDAPPAAARRVAERAAEVGFLELSREQGRLVGRQAARYPDWFDELVGIENKPDLGTPGDLASQLRRDVSLQVLDRVILATASHVTRAHRHRIPDPVGIWRVDPEEPEIEVVREAKSLEPNRPSFEIRAEHPGQFDVAFAGTAQKARQRRRIAERAYGKGWRTYELPACANARATSVAGTDGLPGCAWADRLVEPAAECGVDCPGYEAGAAPEADRTAERARRTPWRPDPAGPARRQSFLDRF
ncbi:hypothetical protein HTSR_1911 [Halodesulfurarchaeum formicicum]|uniref:Uncharacterized protein n=1 Tax=Halodesulfurarchaeum formicicum TaxID=1873524 RepID=A0A1D8S6V1_9EURY|nr:DUF5787 family protein [Halodesulfurarchaeum formicicum]AOW81075.1 hypothetical protein HTSR_1911 [Halodesulfurarchaeum formicicum]APE96411.1 hypothetical protein HSR6_1980 [Halodesulfurarchaeum formicicum]